VSVPKHVTTDAYSEKRGKP